MNDKQPNQSQAQTPKETKPLNTPKIKELSLKDKAFAKQLPLNGYNQLKTYQQVFDTTYDNAQAHASRKTKQMVENGGIDVLNEIDERWIINKLKTFVLNSKKSSDKIRATELLGKWKALFTDKIETKDTTLTPELENALDNYNRVKDLHTN